jgi:uncharacterized protein (TIGR03437 family)
MRFLNTMHMQKYFLLLASATLAFSQQYSITTVAGGAPPATPAAAVATPIGVPSRVTVDSAGNLYFSASNSVFRLGTNGTLTLVAGNSRAGYSGDGGPAVKAQLNAPQGLALDAAGNLYIADSQNNRVRIVGKDGVINTFAGTGATSFGGGPRSYNDGGPANQALLHLPSGVAVDKSGNVFIADTGDNMIRKVTPDGIINLFAGDSYPGYFDKVDGTAIDSEFNKPSDVAVDSAGNVYVADSFNAVVRKISPDSATIANFAGNASAGYSGDNAAATSANIYAPIAIAFDASGNLFIAENADSRIRKVDTKGIITTVAGSGIAGFADGSDASKAQFNFPTGVTVDGSGNIYVADSLNLRIRKVASSSVSSIAGNGAMSYSGDNGPAVAAQLNAPQSVAADASGNFYIADTANNAVRKVAKGGIITNLIGNGQAGNGNNQLSGPQGVAADPAGNVYISDTQNSRVLKVGAAGGVSTLGGSDQFYTPMGLAADAAGNVYVADLSRNMVRKISASGAISTVAGTGNAGFSGDGGAATAALLNSPRAVAVDSAGNLFIADTGNNRIREVTLGGQISTVAGTGLPGFSGDAGSALAAQIGGPLSVAVDPSGNLYFTDGTRVRKVFTSGLIATIAGNTATGYSGDGGVAATAQFNGPAAVAVDAGGNLYVADSGNNAVRLLQPVAGGLGISAVTSGASNQTGVIAPGEIVVLYGSGMGPAQLAQFKVNAAGAVPASLAGTTVYFNGSPAPVLYTSATQVGVVAPFNLTGPKADISVVYQGQVSSSLTVSVAASAPAIFTLNTGGTGPAVAVNQDGSLNDAAHAAPAGSVVTMYATGAGQTNPASQDGAPAAVPLPLPVLPVSVTIGGKSAIVQYAGAAPGLVAGLLQLNVFIPAGLTGQVPVVLQVGSSSSPNGVTIYVQP